MKRFMFPLKVVLISAIIMAVMPACTNLDEELFSEVTADSFFKNEDELISALGAAYTSLYSYMGTTSLYAAQEVSSDALVVPTRGPDWGDGGHWVRLHQHLWTTEDPTVNNTWNFLFAGVNACNRLIFQFSELKDNGGDASLIDPFIIELEALRAVYYLWLMDLYGNVPIVTQFAGADPTPVNNTRAEVYQFVEEALLNAVDKVSANVDGTTYGRVNKMVVHMALAKLYLNAEVYKGTAEWSKCVEQCNIIINSGNYALEPDYFNNFNVDNSGSAEFIFAIPYDAVFAGGFNIVMQSLSYINQQTYSLAAQPWNGWCTVEDFYNSYSDDDLRKGKPNTEDGPSTVRGNFLIGPQWDVTGKVRLEDAGHEANDLDGPPYTFRAQINEIAPNAWREAGARIAKFEFEIGGQPNMNNDFPIYRYADVLLMKAEALWRLGSDTGEALDLVNQIRTRAGVAEYTEADLTAENLLAERGREMFVECHRRTDLIRFGQFTEEWWEKPAEPEWKELFPIPRNQIDANPNLNQNDGY